MCPGSIFSQGPSTFTLLRNSAVKFRSFMRFGPPEITIFGLTLVRLKKMTCEDPISGPKLGLLGPSLETEKYKKYPGFSIEHAIVGLGCVLRKRNLNFGSENIVCV